MSPALVPPIVLPKTCVLLNTVVLLILNVLLDAIFQCSLLVQLLLELSQIIVLFVAPKRVIPPPLAVSSVGEAIEPNSMFLSSTVSVVELIVVVVPLTVSVPPMVTLPLVPIVVIPFSAVIVSPKFTVVEPITTLLLTSLLLAILPANLSLAILPDNMAFVTVALSPVVIMVPFTFGTVNVLVVPVLMPDNWNCIFLVASPSSIKLVVLSLRLLLVSVCVPLLVVTVLSTVIVTAAPPL